MRTARQITRALPGGILKFASHTLLAPLPLRPPNMQLRGGLKRWWSPHYARLLIRGPGDRESRPTELGTRDPGTCESPCRSLFFVRLLTWNMNYRPKAWDRVASATREADARRS